MQVGPAGAGVQRFIHASSIAAYGFHRDNPVGMTEDWPTRPAELLSYAQEKAELEHLLQREADRHPGTALYRLRPPIVVGPAAVGATAPERLVPLLHAAGGVLRHLPGVPVLVPDLPLQLVHQDDVAEALRLCVVGAGPPGAYNVAADDVVTLADLARELGLRAVPVSGRPVAAAARAVAKAPYLPSLAQWVEVLAHPAVMDTTRARTELGWTPRHTAIGSLRAMLRGEGSGR